MCTQPSQLWWVPLLPWFSCKAGREKTSHTSHRGDETAPLEPWLICKGVRRQAAPTGQSVGMENSNKTPPRRELLALAGRSLLCPWATLHACLELLGLAERERRSRYSCAVICSSDYPEAPAHVVCHSCLLLAPWDVKMGALMMDQLLSYLLLAQEFTSSRADRIWCFALFCISWVFQLVGEVKKSTWLNCTS